MKVIMCMEKISSKSIKTLSITTKTKIRVLNEWGHSWKISKAPTRVSWFDRLRRHKSKINLRHKKSISGSYYESIMNLYLLLTHHFHQIYVMCVVYNHVHNDHISNIN